jgi:hypothetical protein
MAIGRSLKAPIDQTAYENLVDAILSGNTDLASNLIKQSTQQGQVQLHPSLVMTMPAKLLVPLIFKVTQPYPFQENISMT